MHSGEYSDLGDALEGALADRQGGIGRYQLEKRLGEGGEAVVYLARERPGAPAIALKILKEEHWDDPSLFHEAAAKMSSLGHPNIIRVLERSRLDEFPPFVALALANGGNLAERRNRERFRHSDSAVRLVLKITLAVHYAHQHGVLHGDLSPSNILLGQPQGGDGQSEVVPYVADFLGLSVQEQSEWQGGKLDYMAPEKAAGEADTVQSDVFSLGVLLFELLTGEVPHSFHTREEVRDYYATRTVASLRSDINSGISIELDAVCRTAMAPNPRDRYGSAEGFAEDLRRVLERLPTLKPLTNRRRRLILWSQRHPTLAAVALLGGLLLGCADIGIMLAAQAQQKSFERSVLHTQEALAVSQAQAILAQFRHYADDVMQVAADPRIATYFNGETPPSQEVLAGVVNNARDMDSVALFDMDSRLVGRYPDPGPKIVGKSFAFRDYAECIRALVGQGLVAEGARGKFCLSRAYRGEASCHMEMSLAAPVVDAEGRAIGYVLDGYHAWAPFSAFTNGADPEEAEHITAIYTERGRDRPGGASGCHAPAAHIGAYVAIAHPRLPPTQEVMLDPRISGQLAQVVDRGEGGVQLAPWGSPALIESSFRDPVTQVESLGAFMPIGRTGYVVAVSTAREKLLGPWRGQMLGMALWVVLLNLGFLALAFVAAWESFRKR